MDKKADIRVVKYENYISKHPKSPYGYYALGLIYFNQGEYKLADSYLKKSLRVDSKYVRAIIGQIVNHVRQGKYLSAVIRTGQNIDLIYEKQVFRLMLIKAVSESYSRGFSTLVKSLSSKLTIRVVLRDFMSTDEKSDNPVAQLLVCMYTMTSLRQFQTYSGRAFEKIQDLLYACVNMEGLDGDFRCELLQVISQKKPEVLVDDAIARKFKVVPYEKCSAEYTNFVFSTMLTSSSNAKLSIALSKTTEIYNQLTYKNMFKYCHYCIEHEVVDMTAYRCMKRLLEAGWTDKVLSNIADRFEKSGLGVVDKKYNKLLQLYGYK